MGFARAWRSLSYASSSPKWRSLKPKEPHQRLLQLTGEEGDGGVMANRSNPELGRARQMLCAIPARKSVWEPGCGLHQGQRSLRPRNIGRTHDRTRPRRTYQIALASTGSSTHASTGSSTHDIWYRPAALRLLRFARNDHQKAVIARSGATKQSRCEPRLRVPSV